MHIHVKTLLLLMYMDCLYFENTGVRRNSRSSIRLQMTVNVWYRIRFPKPRFTRIGWMFLNGDSLE
jgi:hypothetical protein